MTKYYPIMLDISDKKCVIIGGGQVALRKVSSLLSYSPKIIVISGVLCEDLKKIKDQGKIEWVSRNYQAGDLNGAYMAFAATDDQKINQQICNEAQEKKILINIADMPELCSFRVPSKVENGDLTITVSTNGKSPLLAKKIRLELQEIFGEHYAYFLDLMGDLRELSIREIPDINDREALYKELVYSDLLDRLKNGEIDQVKEEFRKIFERYKINKG